MKGKKGGLSTGTETKRGVFELKEKKGVKGEGRITHGPSQHGRNADAETENFENKHIKNVL